MGVWTGLKWVAREGTGAGVQQRLVRLILGSPGRRAIRATSILRHFMAAATNAVKRFGPAWTRRDVLGQAVGVWLLLSCWFVPLVAVAISMGHGGEWSKLGGRLAQPGNWFTAVRIRRSKASVPVRDSGCPFAMR